MDAASLFSSLINLLTFRHADNVWNAARVRAAARETSAEVIAGPPAASRRNKSLRRTA